VELCDEDWEEGMCGRLVKSMYGTRDAAFNWETSYSDFMEEGGFKRGRAAPCVFYHPERNMRGVIHGDDFTRLGYKGDLDWFKREMVKRFEIKLKARLGPEDKDDKHVGILNRVVEWDEEGIKYEADQRHAEIIIREMGLSGSKKGLSVPCSREGKDNGEEDRKELEGSEATRYRALTARGIYLAQDRTDIGFGAKELSRNMAKPCEEDMGRLKQFARYLIGKERVVQEFGYQQNWSEIVDVWTDSDHAGCKRTRKSTSGGIIRLGKHLIKGWCRMQAVVALSSGEAEYYAIVKGASEGMGIRGILWDMGLVGRISVSTDASAAQGVASRRGLGKVKNIELNQLWVQDRVCRGDVKIRKIDGTENLADALTKPLDAKGIEWFCKCIRKILRPIYFPDFHISPTYPVLYP
jgi:hypothetical protein